MNFQEEYSELRLDSIVIGLDNTNFSTLAKFPSNYEIIPWKTAAEKSYAPLKNGEVINSFELEDLNGDDFYLDFSDESKNLMILDFWHLSCAPCLLSMPKLSQLQKKYSDKNVTVIGINPVDKNRNVEILDFKKKLNVEYSSYKAEQNIADKLNIFAYPTIYVLKSGRIIHSMIGYSDEKLIELDSIIKSTLQIY